MFLHQKKNLSTCSWLARLNKKDYTSANYRTYYIPPITLDMDLPKIIKNICAYPSPSRLNLRVLFYVLLTTLPTLQYTVQYTDRRRHRHRHRPSLRREMTACHRGRLRSTCTRGRAERKCRTLCRVEGPWGNPCRSRCRGAGSRRLSFRT